MADFSIKSLRGGANNTDPQLALPEDQAILMHNVELVYSLLGERRLGTTAITLPADLSARDAVTLLHRHLPSDDETAAELWALGLTGTTTAKLCRKTTSWSTITISDTPNLSGAAPYRWWAVSIHGKLFLFYDSDVDRLHVYDGTTLRRAGLRAAAGPPSVAETGSVGTFSGLRYYRVRFTEQISGVTVRRSEPSDSASIIPSGTKTGVVITRPAAVSEGETHWEVEASFDDTTFYVLSSVALATTTYTDTVAYQTGYAPSYTLSESIGDYDLIPSARYGVADEDRLVWAGSWEDATYASRVGWTPVYRASGVGNDERFESDTDPFIDLDTYEGGAITGLSAPVLGAIWVFKNRGIYKLVRTGNRAAAYQAIKFSSQLGAVHGSIVSGVDSTGSPAVYFIDPQAGPCRIGVGGLKRCGEDLRNTWKTINANASSVATSSLFYPKKSQIIWNIAVNSENTPTTGLMLHTQHSRDFNDGVRKGWTTFDGSRAKAVTMCLFSSNIEAGAARNLDLVPFTGITGLGLVHLCDTGNNDNGTSYTATITTRPNIFSLLKKFIVHSAAVCAKAVTNSYVTLKCIRDFNTETTSTVTDVSLAAGGSETDVIKSLDDLKGNEIISAQFQFTDGASNDAQWQLNRLDVREEVGQTA